MKHPKKTSLLQCSASDFPRAQRARAAAVPDDSASILHFLVLCESLQQMGHCAMKGATADTLLPVRVGSKELALLHADKDWYTS